jgi:hypothetical protein
MKTVGYSINTLMVLMLLQLASWPTLAGELSIWQPWDNLLAGAVTEGKINYTLMQRRKAFRTTLSNVAFADTNLLVGKDSQLAFYINSYNVFAIKGVLEGHSPITLWGRHRYFKTVTFKVGGKTVNLHQLEHNIIRPLGDPRIHFALACGAKGCPALRDEAYTADQLDLQLDDATREFINDSSRNQFDRDSKTAHLSMVFQWYEPDFAEPGGVLPFIASYINDPALAQELADGSYKVEFQEFDWKLNGTFPFMK